MQPEEIVSHTGTKPYYSHAGITIFHGDCREILPTLGHVDAVITDPPYGVSFSGKAGHYRNAPRAKRDDSYANYLDTPENFTEIIVPALTSAIAMASCGAVFMASKSIWLLPPGDLGGIFLPNGCGMGSWGFQNFMHVVFYGKDPYLASRLGCFPNGKYGIYGNDSNQIGHPCAKPLSAMRWAVERASLEGQVVLDLFMGSGTTLLAAKNLNRRAIGIEIEEKYCEIAANRLSQEVMDFGGAPVPDVCEAGQAYFNGEDL